MNTYISSMYNNIIRQDNYKSLFNSLEEIVENQTSHVRLVQNVLLVWLDKNIEENTIGFQNILGQLQSVINTIRIFTDQEQCIQYINSLDNENICLLTSGGMSEQIVPSIHNLSQLDSIFILSSDKERYELWSQNWPKIRGIFISIDLLCKNLKQIAQERERNTIPISFVNIDNNISTISLDHLDLTFILSQIIKEISLTIKYKPQYLEQFIRYCYDAFSCNSNVLQSIRNLEMNYLNETPTWWCCYEPFLYPLLNRALRTMDMEILIKMGFFIGDLHRYIEKLHSEQFNVLDMGKTITVYRGQCMTKKKFEQLSKTKGGLLSFNNFVFTSKNHQISLDFANKAQHNPDSVGILFVITIDPSKSSSSYYASLSTINNLKLREERIFFSMHTVFRINDIKPIEAHPYLYQIDLILVNDDDHDLRILTNRIQAEIFPDREGWYRLASYLLKLGQIDKVQQLYESLLKITIDKGEIAAIYGELAMIKSNRGQSKDAITFYQKSLEMFNNTSLSNYSHLADSYSNMGNLYYQMGEYMKAYLSYKQAFEIKQQEVPSNHPSLGILYSNLGLILSKMHNYSDALFFYENALKIQEHSLPSNHPDLAATYNNIGAIYDEIGEYKKALWFYENALKIRTIAFPSNHPIIGISYCNIGNLYHYMGEYLEAQSYYNKGIKIQEESLPSNHSDLASSYNRLGALYEDMGYYSEARSAYEMALEIRQQAIPLNHTHLGDSYNNIGNVYFNMEEYPKALSSYEKALEIRQQSLPSNDPALASSYNNIGAIYDKMKEYPKALSFYERALEIRLKSLRPNHPDLALSYINIGVVYDKISQYEKALSSYEKAIEIQQQSLPPNHPDLASSYNNVGALYEDTHNYPQALAFYQRALEIRQQSLPTNHPDLSMSYNNIGVVYHQMKDYEKALSYYEAELNIQEKLLSPNHPHLASLNNKIGALYEDMGDNLKARSSYGRAIYIGRHSLPSDHPHLQMYKKNLNSLTKNST